jgi:NitT/TauT family transport system substrate-binding protein
MRRATALIALAAFGASTVRVAQAQTPPIVIRIATPGNDGNALCYYAQDLGIFKRYGITSQIQTIRAGSGAGIASAVAGGSVDIGESDITAVANARDHGIPLTLLAPGFMHRGALGTSGIVVAKNASIHTARDLNGLTLAVPSLTGPARVSTMKWLEKNGADLTSIKFVEMPQVAMAAAVAHGTVAAAELNEPALTASFDQLRDIGSPYDAIGNPVQVTAWFATADWVKNNPDAAKRFVGATHEAAVWANNPANAAASGAILEKYTPFPPELLGKMRRAAYGEAFDPALMQPVLDASFDEHSLAHRANARDMISPVALLAK